MYSMLYAGSDFIEPFSTQHINSSFFEWKKTTPVFSKGHHPHFVNTNETQVCSPWNISGRENSVTTLLGQGSWEEMPVYAKATNSLRQDVIRQNGWLRQCLSRAGIANYAPRDTSHADAKRDSTDLPGLHAWSPALRIPWCLLTWPWLVGHWEINQVRILLVSPQAKEGHTRRARYSLEYFPRYDGSHNLVGPSLPA